MLHSQLMSYNPLEQVMRTLAQKQLLWQGEIMEETTTDTEVIVMRMSGAHSTETVTES